MHVNWVSPSKMHWTVWSSTQALGHGIDGDMGTFPITVTLTRPRIACGHRVFTRASFSDEAIVPIQCACDAPRLRPRPIPAPARAGSDCVSRIE